ncbi:MAG: phosphoglycerate dehydrogenase, partial [Proteobacteria bacterium]|nr:phosphoglycerate dehydrogenase [Pseudomonadota bacterium]
MVNSSSHSVLVTDQFHPQTLEQLCCLPNISVDNKPSISRQELLEIIPKYQVILTRSGTSVDQQLIDAGSSLQVVARGGVGIANIDLEYATKKGILVVNAPGVNTQSAAEITIALLLSMTRKLPEAQTNLKQGGWDRHRFKGSELNNKTIGIIGFGHVGRRVAMIASGFGMTVEAYDPYIAPQIFDYAKVTRRNNLNELTSSCDILSPHVPLNEETRGMIGEKQLMSLKKSSWVLNTARGGVICEESLIKVLNSGHLSGAAIDTWESEPSPRPELVNHPLVYGTPHIGAATEEAQLRVGQKIVAQIHKALSGDVVDHPVNIPGIESTLGQSTSPTRTFMVLAEKLGRLAQQILEFQPSIVELNLPKNLSDPEKNLLTIAFQKGYLFQVSHEFISYANATVKFANTGLSINLISEVDQPNVFPSSFEDTAITITLRH